VTLAVRSVDGIFLQDYVPKLMCQAQGIRFLLHRSYAIPVPAVLGKFGRACVPSSGTRPRTRSRWCASRRESKEEVAGRYLERASRSGVYMIGVAQERAMAWRGWRRDARTATRTSSSAASRCSSTPLVSMDAGGGPALASASVAG
jgi:hypothetical protein